MPTQFILLCVLTLLLWSLVIIFHRLKNKITLIPLYSYIALLTLLTHNLSDLGFAVVMGNWYFLIASVAFFTSLMLGILLIYLFEGPRAARTAISVVIITSFFYIGVVWSLHHIVDTSGWAAISIKSLRSYFWSLTAIIIDVFFIAVFWEVMGKIKRLPVSLRIFLVVFGTFLLDSLIYVTGVFIEQPVYTSILQGNIATRLILAAMITPIATLYLKTESYSAESDNKTRSLWEVFNFRSDLETKIQSMEEIIKTKQALEKQLEDSRELFAMALEGANAGIWDWDIVNNHIMYSAKFHHLLGFEDGTLDTSIEAFKTFLHPDDVERTFGVLDACFKTGKPYAIEYRLKNKDGSFKWYAASGVTKFDSAKKPIRMVGSIIDIDEKVGLINSYREKVAELERFNRLMVGRELKMKELKEELGQLKKN